MSGLTTAYLGIGSNVDAQRHVRAAVNALRDSFGEVRLSPIYRSRAVGFEGDDFLNLVVAIDTAMGVIELRDWLRELEARHGRRRDVPKFSDRTLDVDILLFGEQALQAPGLELPRAEILRFAHVLRPLAELAPGLHYPGRPESLQELWRASTLREVPLQPVNPGFIDP